MLPRGGDVVPGRKLLHHLDIGGKARAGEAAFQEIVAEYYVIRNTARHGAFNDVDVIDALTNERAFLK